MRADSCCSVEVVNGAAGRREYGFDSTFETVRGDAVGARAHARATLGDALVEHDRLALQPAGVVEVAAGGDALAAEAHEARLERWASSPDASGVKRPIRSQ